MLYFRLHEEIQHQKSQGGSLDSLLLDIDHRYVSCLGKLFLLLCYDSLNLFWGLDFVPNH